MPTNYSGRVALIVGILLLFLWAIFPSAPKILIKPFKPETEVSFRPDLKPGIDMVGGTSLLYEIKPPEGGYTHDLAERVMQSLKKRVDPDGVRNLIWRPQGNTRLEIQMPLRPGSEKARGARDAFAAAQRQLEATNVRPGEVTAAVQDLKGDARRTKLAELEMGSQPRGELFAAMAAVWDQMQQAHAQRNAAEEARLQIEYDKLRNRIVQTNLTVSELQTILELRPELQRERLDEVRKRSEGFEARQKAIDNFIDKYAGYRPVKDLIDDAATLKMQLRGSGVLEFYILATPPGVPGHNPEDDPTREEYEALVKRLHERGPQFQAGDRYRWFLVDNPQEYSGLTEPYNDKLYALVHTAAERSLTQRAGQPKWGLTSAYPLMQDGERVVGFQFDTAGAKYFGELTGRNVGRPLGIVLDGRLISAPNINNQIFGNGIIQGGAGGFSQQEFDYLIRTLDAGSLPAQLTEEPISERSVGPQLGADNLRAGLIACIFGLVVVAVFLIGYYYLAGVVAMIAVLLNMVLILGAMAALNATFTLPGVAGIVLTIGMAVDANVLIFERLREEQVRGLSLRMALRNAYDRAFSAILDSNVTTGITSLILYWFGTEEVKGFGLTLLIGLASSLFTALFVTRTIFGILIDRFNIQKLGSFPLTFPRWDRALRPNIDWIGKAWAFMSFSAIFIVVGLTAFGIRWSQDKVLDIEFASGTAVQFELKEPMEINELRQIIEAQSKQNPAALPAPSVVTVGDDRRTYEIVTPNKDARAVRTAVLDALEGKLNITPQVSFEQSDQPFTEAMDKHIVPITGETTSLAGMAPPQLRSHVGGVAVVLNNLDPPIGAEEIRRRIEAERLQPSAGGETQAPRYRPLDVEVSNEGRVAVVMSSDPNFPYDADNEATIEQWRQELAAPTWDQVRAALTKPAELQKVNNFDPQVATEARTDALIAMTLSIIVIMAYIWLRFGNLRYGTATVVALLHDTLFTLAAIGVAHYIANTAVGPALLIEPFRINLTMVAAILTVMGWSMNDTVVVFDRVRENRGKFGHLDRQVVNDSINQTLSRTLLTGGTTIVTIFVMYVFGGPGIHGFTFALLVGILVGTYSSIAIASPLLLIGLRQSRQAAVRDTSVGRGQLQRA
jgi:SecD/SecF fusion protein